MRTSISRFHLSALTLLSCGVMVCAGAHAQPVAQQVWPAPLPPDQPRYAPAPEGRPSTVVARVIGVAPISRQVPVRVCNPDAAAPTGGGAAVGALAGGAVGSQLGNGNGHIAGAIIGAIGGAIAGNAIESQNRAAMGAGCTVRYQNQISGYDVRYEWGGQRYRTTMPNDPGQWIRVTEPVGNGSYAQSDMDYERAPYPDRPPQYAPPPGSYSQGQAYPQGYYSQPYPPPPPAPVYQAPPVYRAPAYVAPAPVYVAPPVGVSIGIGAGGRRSGIGVGIGF